MNTDIKFCASLRSSKPSSPLVYFLPRLHARNNHLHLVFYNDVYPIAVSLSLRPPYFNRLLPINVSQPEITVLCKQYITNVEIALVLAISFRRSRVSRGIMPHAHLLNRTYSRHDPEQFDFGSRKFVTVSAACGSFVPMFTWPAPAIRLGFFLQS
ncbi:hypothetical protein GQ43DRAFT_489145 [Delitschia confertaspora ATCC 74209]|uniref:Uncharacterized protein n=1 Tax=Delitschia confertaspora ATCC 74209 TaxID=1513339 RepID=A0A9P4MRM2_9PLEO|nr:hypothetical protein GQ43DRAFT_489145 [Delitschia confertaspora ATCC 74209]